MAYYASVTQADMDEPSAESPSLQSPDLEHSPCQHTSDSYEHLDVQEKAKPAMFDKPGRANSIHRSLASSQSAYEMVEKDDDEDYQVRPLSILRGVIETFTPPSERNEHSMDVERTPMRTASISRDLPLNHPISLQGPQDRNVARLEESAERLSMTSSLKEELQRIKREQKRLERKSSSSTTSSIYRNASGQHSDNSIIGVNSAARSGGYSPAGYVTSPRGSIRESSWIQPADRWQSVSQTASQNPSSVPQHFNLSFSNRNLNLDFSQSEDVDAVPRPSPPSHDTGAVIGESSLQQCLSPYTEDGLKRSETQHSTDTSRETRNLFIDFDGVHHGLQETEGQPRRISLTQPPLASNGTAHDEPQVGQNMVYYPAPVPMMLNLPQRLSKMQGVHDRETRRLQALSLVPPEMRNSAVWLKEQDEVPVDPRRNTQVPTNLPAQLRASAFFDRPSAQPAMKLVNSSAMATLDSLLDASANAPVSAFTDHPIAGRLGREVYGRTKTQHENEVTAKEKPKDVKRRSSWSNLLNFGSTSRFSRRESGAPDLDAVEEDGNHSQTSDDLDQPDLIAPSDAEEGEEEMLGSQEEEEADHRAYLGPPTTLLAELQMRKLEQKSRNRTAANTFPNGMHSTLLELDAVTQLQQRSRKLKHVRLAWEDQKEINRDNLEDDDVPLGLLFRGTEAAAIHANRPMGLMEKREVEDNEPLSRRRARLRGEPLQSQAATSVRLDNRPMSFALENQNNAKVNADTDEDEGETLGQRKARLAAKKIEKKGDVGSMFAHEVSSELGLPLEEATASSKTPNVDETLAQRKKRLQQEQVTRQRQSSGQSLNSRHSMADILQKHPAAGSGSVGAMGARPGFYPSQSYTPQVYGPTSVFVPAGFPQFMPPYMQSIHTSQAGMQAGGAYGIPLYLQDAGMGPPLDPKQRDQIDRWRQGIVPGA